jgi:hypothetical protein
MAGRSSQKCLTNSLRPAVAGLRRGRRMARLTSALAGMQNGVTNHFSVLVTNDDIVVRNLTIGSVTWFFKVDVKDVSSRVVGRPQIFEWRFSDRSHDLQELVDLAYGRICLVALTTNEL